MAGAEREAGGLMREQWEKICQIELDFYRNWDGYKREIESLLKENQMTIRCPRTVFEYGEVRVQGADVENQVIDRMAREHTLKTALKNGEARKIRLLNNLEKLSEEQSSLLWYMDIEKDFVGIETIMKIFGYRSRVELIRAKEKALIALYEIYKNERIEEEEEFKKERSAERMRIRESMKLAN